MTMRRWFLLGMLLWTTAASAQQQGPSTSSTSDMRLWGRDSTGYWVPVVLDSSGNLPTSGNGGIGATAGPPQTPPSTSSTVDARLWGKNAAGFWVPVVLDSSGKLPTSGTFAGSANTLTLAGSSAGNPVTLTATGSDTDISLYLVPKGTGPVVAGPTGAHADVLGLIDSTPFATIGVDGNGVTGYMVTYADAAQFSGMVFASSRGTYTAPTNSADGDIIGGLQSYYKITGGFGLSARLYAKAEGPAGTDAPGAWYLFNSLPGKADGNNELVRYGWHETTNAGYRLWMPAITTGAGSEATAFTNNYYSWFDSRGVRRVREDSTFDSVAQAIETLYNPQFTKYTAGLANYERVVLGQWNGNVAEIGNESGGTGTLRDLRLIGANIQLSVDTILANGKAFKTDATTAHTALIQAYDVDAAAYVTFCTLTNANAPSMACSPPAGGGTIGITSATLTTPVLSGSITGTYTLAGTPTITAPALSGTITGTYTLGGTPTLASAAGVPYVAGVAAGYKLARGSTTLDGSNPSTAATGLATIVSCTASLKTTSAPGDDPSWNSLNWTGSDGNLDIYAWKNTGGTDPTLVASTNNSAVFSWICIGT